MTTLGRTAVATLCDKAVALLLRLYEDTRLLCEHLSKFTGWWRAAREQLAAIVKQADEIDVKTLRRRDLRMILEKWRAVGNDYARFQDKMLTVLLQASMILYVGNH